ncbi:MAG TPA: polysaccharide biosynthesis tyrosine autokinase [Candidatus Tectomicrobia bacterium]|nr:polysaccharide biosynthesis tyrosine autokinase [Candidatus Tectomicrobia bacterium]
MDTWRIVKRIAQGVLRRRKRLAVVCFLLAAVIALPTAYIVSKQPPRYRTTATILIEARPDRVPLFQEFSPFRPIGVQFAILRSRSLAEAVAEQLPKSSLQDLIEHSYQSDFQVLLGNLYTRLLGAEPEVESPHRRAVNELQRARVQFVTQKNGLVNISTEASRPQVAIDIANGYIEALLARTRSFNIDDARVQREFLEHQLNETKKTMTAAEQALRGFVGAHGGVKVPERAQATVARLSQVESALAEATSSRKMLESRLQSLRERVEQQKRQPAPPAPAAAPPPAPLPPDLQRLRAQLTQLEGALLDLRTKYTEEHPRVVLVKDRIAEVRAQLGDAVKASTAPLPASAAVPPAERVNFAEQLVALEASYHSVVAQEDALRNQANALRRDLQGLSQSELEYARLTREMDSARNLHALISDKLTAARIREQGEMKSVKVVDPPSWPRPVGGEKRMLYLLAALGVACVVGAGVPAGVELVRRKIENEDDVTAATGLPVLSVLPRLRRPPQFVANLRSPGRGGQRDAFIVTESFRTLAIEVQLAARTQPIRTLLIASALAGEGKSTVVVNLGLAFREAGRRVVLVDSDFFRPTLHQLMQVRTPATGLTDTVRADGDVGEALVPVSERLWLMPRGRTTQPDSRALIASQPMHRAIQGLADRADIVICDSSPVLLFPDNLFLASAVDAVVLVAHVGTTGCADLERAKVELDGVGARVIGVVLNGVPPWNVRSYYSRYYGSYYSRGEA